jgi:hypothetical protein
MLNRLGLVIHFLGFFLGVVFFIATLSMLVGDAYYEWKRGNEKYANMLLKGLQEGWDTEREDELNERGKMLLEKAREAGLISDFLRLNRSEFGGIPIPEDEQEFKNRIENPVRAFHLDPLPEFLKPSIQRNFQEWSNPWYFYVLGIIISPIIIVLILSPFWAIRFILTSHKSPLPWVANKETNNG